MIFPTLTIQKAIVVSLLIIAGMLLAPPSLWGQSANHEAIILEIKTAYQRINTENLEGIDGSYFRNPNDGHSQTDYQAFFEQGQLVLLSQNLHDYSYFESTLYYLKDGQLSFVSRDIEIDPSSDPERDAMEGEGVTVEAPEEVRKTEEVFYFHQGEVINKPHDGEGVNLFGEFNSHIKQFLRSQIEYHPHLTAAQKASYISDIRKAFQRIEDAELTEKQLSYRDKGQEEVDYINSKDAPDLIDYEHTGYYDEGELVKISSKWSYLMAIGTGGKKKEVVFRSGTTHYYFRYGELFFVYDVSSYQEDGITTEARYYFHGFAMIQALIKEGFAPLDQIKSEPHPILSEPGDMYRKTWQLNNMMENIWIRLKD